MWRVLFAQKAKEMEKTWTNTIGSGKKGEFDVYNGVLPVVNKSCNIECCGNKLHQIVAHTIES